MPPLPPTPQQQKNQNKFETNLFLIPLKFRGKPFLGLTQLSKILHFILKYMFVKGMTLMHYLHYKNIKCNCLVIQNILFLQLEPSSQFHTLVLVLA